MNVSDVSADGCHSMPRVMLIEEDEALASAVLHAAKQAEFNASWARTGAEALLLKATLRPHVVLMDLVLSDLSGMALLARLAEARDCGIIVISGMDDEADRIAGLELGADDYMAKPPGLRELVARIKAVHRRVSNQAETCGTNQVAPTLHVGLIRINVLHRTVRMDDGQHIALTSAEFAALETLAIAAGGTVSRDTLSKAALRRPWRPEDRSVDQLIFNLRQKLPTDEGGGMLIQSIRGSGYSLRAPNRAPVHSEGDGRS